MPYQQQKFREVIFQMLYSLDVGKADEDELVLLIMKELAVTKKNVLIAFEKVKKIQEILPKIDDLIAKTSQSYQFERIQNIERNVLRLAVYEMLFDDDIPPKVAIAEAIRLARKFATPESAAFINAILDALYQSSLGKNIDNTLISRSVDALIKSEEIANQAAKEERKKTEDEED